MLRTKRLILDKPVSGDVEPLHQIYSDPRVWGHLPTGRHTSVAQTQEMVNQWIRGWDEHGLSAWVVRDTSHCLESRPRVVGVTGCWMKNEVIWNLGYRFAHEAHGRGYATEAAKEAMAAATRLAPEVPIVAILLEHNEASARVAEKLGLSLRHRGRDAGNPDPDAVRLIYADRPLTPKQNAAALA